MTTSSEEPKCVHDWQVKGKASTSPRRDPFLNTVEGPSGVIRALMQGTTSFLLTCSKCGAIETRELYGQAVEP